MTDIVDAHHHIWRQADLPWLDGPMQPRIFGPYEPIRRDYLIERISCRYRRHAASSNPSTCRPTGPKDASRTRSPTCSEPPTRPAGRRRSSAMPTFMVADVRPQLDRLTKYPLLRGVRMQLHWHENPQYRFAAQPDLARDRDVAAATSRGSPTTAGASICRSLPARWPGAADSPTACPKVTFVLQHAGMLEDLSPDGLGSMARRHAAARRAAGTSFASSRRSARSFTAMIRRISPAIVRETRRHFRRRSAACSARTSRSRSSGPAMPILSPPTATRARPFGEAAARASVPRHRGAGLSAQLTAAQSKRREEHMALEIKILDYGDIELESSFLVLGRDCGRTRRVPTLGFLILGGTWPIVVDTGYRSNQIMETLGMRGLQFHENMIENQLKQATACAWATCATSCTRTCISTTPARTTSFPMNTTVVINRRELEYSVSGLMHPQYPAARHQASDRPAAHQGRAALPRSGNLRADRVMPGRDLRGGRRAHRRLDECASSTRPKARDDLRRRDLRLQRSDRRALPRDQRHGAARHRQPRHDQARRRRRRSRSCSPASHFLLPVHDRPAQIEGGAGGRPPADAVPGPVVQSLPQRNWFPA